MRFDFRAARTLTRCALALCLATGVAHADASAGDRENARTYMAEGRTKRDSGDLKSALKAFQAADMLMHVPTTALEVARTQSMLGMLIEAHEGALQIARTQAKPGDPPPFAEARSAAQKLADDIEPRIPSIRLLMKNADGATVTIDDAIIPSVALGLARKVDPGAHVVVAKLGATERRANVQVVEREAKEVPLDFGEAAIAPNTNTTTTTTTTTTGTGDVVPPSGGGETRKSSGRGPWIPLGITTLALGGASVAIGGLTGILSLSQTNDIKQVCSGTVCQPTLKDGTTSTSSAIASAKTLATISDITFIAGGVLAAFGTVFVIIGASKKATTAMEVRIGPGSFSLLGKF